MQRHQFHIVGMAHRRDLEGAALPRFYAAVAGRWLMLRHDPDNTLDALAIAAYDWRCRHVGYVAHDELPLLWHLLAHSDTGHLRAQVESVSREHNSLTCHVESDLCVARLPELQHVEAPAWQWPGPRLPRTHQMRQYDVLHSAITEQLSRPQPWTPDEHTDTAYILEAYATAAALDISFEVRSEVATVATLLRRQGMHEWAARMSRITSQTGTRVGPGGDVAAYWSDFATGSTADTAFTRRAMQLTDEEIDRAIQGLPLDLFHTWTDMPDAFFAYVYYHHIPRQLLLEICSLMAAMAVREGDAVGSATARPAIPPELDTPEARLIWHRLEQAGLVDSTRALLPSLTRQTAMYIALQMSNTLWGETRWKPFEAMWHTRNLAQLQQKMKDSGRLPRHATEIDTCCANP